MATNLRLLSGVGAKRETALRGMGIDSIEGLLLYFPRRYQNLSVRVPLADMPVGQESLAEATVASDARLYRTARVSIVSVTLRDESGLLQAVWYNQPYVRQHLRAGAQYLFIGKVTLQKGRKVLANPVIEQTDAALPPMLPVYALPSGITQRLMRQMVQEALPQACVTDVLPPFLRDAFALCGRFDAMRQMHFPQDERQRREAQRRIVFEEFLLFQLQLEIMRKKRTEGEAYALMQGDAQEERLRSALPYPLTGAQQRVWKQITKDMARSTPMNRLVQGDVGSGKTIIAFLALYRAVCNGKQGALMAPTEILADQHRQSAAEILEPLGVQVELLKSSLGAKEKRHVLERLQSGACQVVIGTHALLQDAVEFQDLAVVVTDEQHRFGVRQRAAISQKGMAPHVLVMSATPIPRTLSLVLYGDLDISIVDELPPGRQPVKTHIVPPHKRSDMYQFILHAIQEGKQAYIICPLVAESEVVDAASAEEMFAALRKTVLGRTRLALVHGQLPNREKEEVMRGFAAGQFDVLVATTVIEVGVNVPNACIMVIENAERFGLAQLHQLRGRVGRSQTQSFCFLMTEQDHEEALERLRIMTETNDGFLIAEKDLEMRGAGELIGEKQHGMDAWQLLRMAGDMRLQDEVRQALALLGKEEHAPEYEHMLAMAREKMAQLRNAYAMN